VILGTSRTAAGRLGWLLFAVVGGVLWGLCFGHTSPGVEVWLALVPLPLLLTRRHAGWLCFAYGVAAWETSLCWIVPTLIHYGSLSWPVAVLLASVLAVYLALFHALFGRLGGPLWRRWLGGAPAAAASGTRWWLALIALPSLWVGLEWLRTYCLGGFPWNLAAYAWIDVPGALPLTAFIGAYGVSLLAMWVAVGAAASLALRLGRQPHAGWPLVAGLALPLLLLPMAGRWSLRHAAGESYRAETAGLAFNLLQPNIANQVGFDLGLALRDYRKLTLLSDVACEPGSLVIWPESAGWPFEYHRDPLLDSELTALVARGCSVIFNTDTPVPGSGQDYNSAYLLTAGAAPERYDKRHLVPFGEYVPFEKVLFFAKTVARNIGQFRAADRLALLPWHGELLGPAICYEVVFPEETAALTQAGATILVTITNDGWYGDTAAPWQHLRAARFRAAENRRPMVRAAITGVSAVIAPDGSLRSELGVGQQGILRARVAGEHEMTPYARWPWLPPLAASLIALAACVAVYTSRPRS
jgi:apolipoprotein N-acyltransferase